MAHFLTTIFGSIYHDRGYLKNDESVKAIPILVITGQEYGQIAERLNGMYDGFVSKPFKKAALINATIQYLPGTINKNANTKKRLCNQTIKTL